MSWSMLLEIGITLLAQCTVALTWHFWRGFASVLLQDEEQAYVKLPYLFPFFFSFFFTMITYLFSTWNRMYGLHILMPYNVLENKETVLACCVTRKSPRLPAGKVKWWWGPLLSWSYFYSKICLVIKFIFFLFRFDLQFIIIYCYQLFAVNQRLA